jgi:hypothetical protein
MIWINNGGYIPYLYFFILYISNDYLLTTALTIRLFTINYFVWFINWDIQNQLRQFVRFTDTQTLVCLLYWWFNKSPIIAELTYNVLFLVSVGFWIGKLMGIDENLPLIKYPFFQKKISNLYHYINHGLLFLLMAVKTPHNYSINGCNNTLLFILFYLMLIYIPWYFITGDTIYNI